MFFPLGGVNYINQIRSQCYVKNQFLRGVSILNPFNCSKLFPNIPLLLLTELLVIPSTSQAINSY